MCQCDPALAASDDFTFQQFPLLNPKNTLTGTANHPPNTENPAKGFAFSAISAYIIVES
jgi:hypothetical protein